ncbi:MAG: hypothetical protein K6F75_07755 [Butyrivibrio sp.]|nr:hypothetical protein [Butyrivibrio sp.]
MKIAQGNVNLVSSHQYYEENTVAVQTSVMTRGTFMESLQNQEKKMDSLELGQGDEGAISSENYTSLKPAKTEYLGSRDATLEDMIAELRTRLLQNIMDLLQILGGEGQSSGYKDMMRQTSNMLTSNMFVKTTTVELTHIEEEYTTFQGKGMALTEDGRTIDFNVDFSLSRRFTEYAGISVSSAVSLIDPLVINVGSEITSISDQSFFFDLDSDGTEDKISKPGTGTGFLSYDKNGDGIINNGTELFGTKSGDGFKDLAQYDLDNNGWIDENDEIYYKLKVWLKNEDGTDTLLSLGEADVGAIYLGSAQTQYTHQNSENFMVSAMMRTSGVFLKESGGVGTVHQVDMAAL